MFRTFWHRKGIMTMEIIDYGNEEVQLPESITKKINNCFSIFNNVVNREEIIKVFKAEINLANKYRRSTESDLINKITNKVDKIVFEDREAFKRTLREKWKTFIENELDKMEPSAISTRDSEKRQQLTGYFITKLTEALNESKKKLKEMLYSKRNNKCVSRYYSKTN